MDYYLNYSGGRIHFSVPPEWNVLSSSDCAKAPVVGDVAGEVERSLDNPIGMPPLEEFAGPGMKAVLLFDDPQRPTPAAAAIPPLLDRLNRAGIGDDRVRAVCARGTHPAPTQEQLQAKLGPEGMRRLEGRISIHDAQSGDNVLVGRTRFGTAVEINRNVAEADLVIGIGTCIPHPYSGFGGGCKMILPGVCSYQTIGAHHYSWLRNRDSRLNKLEGNPWYEESVEAARLAGLSYKLDFLLDEAARVIGAFFGDPVAEHRQAADRALSLSLVRLPRQADVVITSASPMEIGVQATKALLNSRAAVRSGGTIIWAAAQRQAGPLMALIEQMAAAPSANDYHRRLLNGDIPESLRPFGISFFMLGVPFKELSEKYRVIQVTEGLSREQVTMMQFEYAGTVEEAIRMAREQLPRADVTILPSGGTIIPIVQ